MAGSDKVAGNTGEFVACAGLEFPPPSKLMVAQRFPSKGPYDVLQCRNRDQLCRQDQPDFGRGHCHNPGGRATKPCSSRCRLLSCMSCASRFEPRGALMGCSEFGYSRNKHGFTDAALELCLKSEP